MSPSMELPLHYRDNNNVTLKSALSSSSASCPSLSSLPSELLAQIVGHLKCPKDLATFASTCRTGHDFMISDGWRTFVVNSFPNHGGNDSWNEQAHYLSNLERAWKARKHHPYKLKYLDSTPAGQALAKQIGLVFHQLNGAPALNETPASPPPNQVFTRCVYTRRPKGQTMGFQAMLDCFETSVGDTWSSRKEHLAIGAGAGLVVRTKSMQNVDSALPTRTTFTGWRDVQFKDGRDDITSLNILRQKCLQNDDCHIVLGRANGSLQSVSMEQDDVKLNRNFLTGSKSPITAMHHVEGDVSLLSAATASEHLSLYDLNSQDNEIVPVWKHDLSEGNKGQIWCTQFLSSDLLAVGRGPSESPLQIYRVRPDGAVEDAIRTFRGRGPRICVQRDDVVFDLTSGSKSSVYAIKSLDADPLSGHGPGNVFLTGRYEGYVQLHDLRCPEESVATFVDSFEPDGSIYSLLLQGEHRFIAGKARYTSIDIFDMRMHKTPARRVTDTAAVGEMLSEVDLNMSSNKIFFQPQPETGRQTKNKPIYSLASGSRSSCSFYIGTEDYVIGMDTFDAEEKHPDSLISAGWIDTSSGGDPKRHSSTEHVGMLEYSNRLARYDD